MPSRRRRNCLCRVLTAAGAASVSALLFFGRAQNAAPLYSRIDHGGGTWSLQQQRLFPSPGLLLSPPPEYLISSPRQISESDISFARRLLPIRDRSLPPLEEDGDESPPQLQEEDAVLLPDREVLVLAAEPAVGNARCVFQGGVSSPARALGRLPGPGRHAYLCPLPDSEPPLQPPPLLLSSSPSSSAAPPATAPAADFRKLLNWNDSLVFDSTLLHGGDLLLFAKGTNRRQGVIHTATGNIQCIYSGADGMVASFPATTSGQQLIRCPPPLAPLNSSKLHVTVSLNGQEPLPSLATYNPQKSSLSVASKRKLICACTMVRNVAKFLPEWVRYHAAVGVEEFFIYDNGSADDLAEQVDRLNSDGIDISTVAWPWTKTQEAGLSHCAASNQHSCQWMAFIDVDEFIFSPGWNKFETPSKSLLESVVVSADAEVGQIYLPCYDFGPSGQTAHPKEGVCQGYTCRLEHAERHKSLVRLDAVADSLVNSVHHFALKSGFHKAWSTLTRINHYKFQAWTEFKSKFIRRVSAYVADWTDPINLQSHDRAPGLGVDPVEPVGWAESFCEYKDKTMKELSEKWFGIGFRGRGTITEFDSNGDIAPSPSLP